MSLDDCRWLSRSDSLPRPGHGLILVELITCLAVGLEVIPRLGPRWLLV
ncbi:MAG: hypothetical protein QOJ06_1815 [Pseudonocardiales bacterium]|jgi:hypothetical protein|nr:hypothetical protein [Pseudonocardiales bacterium]